MSDLKTNLEAILQEKQDKIIPANIKKDVQIFDVIGTYTGNSGTDYEVKLFETEEEMQADENAQEGDLAVVYRSEIQNMTVDTQTQYITFPETVTLPEAVTSDYYCMLRAIDTSVMFDGNVQLGATSFMFNGYTDTGMIRVEYSSADGITYNRTRFTGDSGDLTNPVDFGTTIQVYMPEEWNNNFGYFMQIGGNTFEGLYEYDGIQYNIVETQLDATADLLYNSIAYGKNGVIEGTLTQNVSNSFADINAEVYNKIQKAYDNMEPRVLTDNDKTIDKNIYFIPTKSDGTSLLDTSNVTDMSQMFQYCTNLATIPLLDTSNVTDMSQMFYDCSSLINIPQLDTSNVTNMYYMFKNCSNLTVIPQLNTHNVTNMQNVFTNCSNLTTIPELDISSVTNMDYAFIHCDNISNDSLNNILASLLTATSYTKTKTLNIIGLSEEQAQICTTLSNYQAFTEAGWTTGY